MTSIFFQGFNPIIPLLVWILVLLFCFAGAWWSYAYLETVTTWKKWALILLRGSVFSILALLLLNPFFIDRSVEESKPVINIYLDNSQSLTVERGSYTGLDDYLDLSESVFSQIDDRFDLQTYLFDSSVNEGELPEGVGAFTNLQSVVDHQIEQQQESVAHLLLSDGIVTQGRNPVFSAQNLSTPIFTIPVGDTTTVRDVVINDVEFNPVSYTNTEQTFRVTVNQDGFEGETADIQFLKEGDLIDTESISFSDPTSSHLVVFTDRHDEAGFREYEINIPGLDEEFTLQNNREQFTVEVIDEKTRIVSLAFGVHPDIGSIRRLLATDQQNELISATRLNRGRLTGEDPTDLDSPPDLILLHGLPESDDPLLDWIAETDDVPVVYFLLPGAQDRQLELSQPDFIPYTIETSRNDVVDLHLLQELDPYSHPLLEFSPQEFRRFPTLKTNRSDVEASAIAEVLFSAEFQRTETGIPVLITQSTGNKRLAAVNAYGWNRYERTANSTVSSFYSQFFNDLISWAATSPDQQNLTIEPVKPTFSETEEIEIRASLVNERQQPETDAVIEINISDAEGNTQEEISQRYVLRHTGSGEYQVEVGNLPEGTYEIEGTATKADRQLGTDRSRFDVSQSMVEFIDTKRNDLLLEQLALRSGGLFLEDQSLQPMLDYLSEEGLDQVVERENEETRYFNSHPLWFILAILCLTGEWILRRTLSLP